jgi:hypothetical protein
MKLSGQWERGGPRSNVSDIRYYRIEWNRHEGKKDCRSLPAALRARHVFFGLFSYHSGTGTWFDYLMEPHPSSYSGWPESGKLEIAFGSVLFGAGILLLKYWPDSPSNPRAQDQSTKNAKPEPDAPGGTPEPHPPPASSLEEIKRKWSHYDVKAPTNPPPKERTIFNEAHSEQDIRKAVILNEAAKQRLREFSHSDAETTSPPPVDSPRGYSIPERPAGRPTEKRPSFVDEVMNDPFTRRVMSVATPQQRMEITDSINRDAQGFVARARAGDPAPIFSEQWRSQAGRTPPRQLSKEEIQEILDTEPIAKVKRFFRNIVKNF